MPLKDYSNLPDFMDSSNIVNLIEEILDTASVEPNLETIDVAEALLEMIDRQSNNYGEKLDEKVVYRMQRWVADSWSLSPPELINVLSIIIINLENESHFPDGYQMLTSALCADNPEVQAIAKEALAEMPHN